MALIEELKPTVDGVALLLRTRTVGPGPGLGLGGDTGPADRTTFGSDTRPSALEVQDIVTSALVATLGEIGVAADGVPGNQVDNVKHAVALYAAILIEVSFFRESVNQDQLNLWREMRTAMVKTVTKTVDEVVKASGGFCSLTIGTTR